jgi:hypothetical protein
LFPFAKEHTFFLEVIFSIIWADPFLQQVRRHYFVTVFIALLYSQLLNEKEVNPIKLRALANCDGVEFPMFR